MKTIIILVLQRCTLGRHGIHLTKLRCAMIHALVRHVSRYHRSRQHVLPHGSACFVINTYQGATFFGCDPIGAE